MLLRMKFLRKEWHEMAIMAFLFHDLSCFMHRTSKEFSLEAEKMIHIRLWSEGYRII
jgi:hypothetical protein